MDADVFWEKINTILAEKDKNKEWLAKSSGILSQTIRNQIHLSRIPSLDDTMKILKALGMTWDEFERYPKKKPNVPMLAVYEQAFSAGKGQFVPDDAEVKEWVAVPSELRGKEDRLAAAYVRGDSMQPTLYDGDIIILEKNGYDNTDGIFAIIYKGAGFVKRLQRDIGGIKIVSDNKLYEPMSEPESSEDFSVVGKVRYVVHRIG